MPNLGVSKRIAYKVGVTWSINNRNELSNSIVELRSPLELYLEQLLASNSDNGSVFTRISLLRSVSPLIR